MSRSYKKFPISRMARWGRSMKKGKQYANRKIRRKLKNPTIECSNGCYYKSLGLDSWDLWEFKFLETKQDAINDWKSKEKLLTNNIQLEERLNDWAKYYKRK